MRTLSLRNRIVVCFLTLLVLLQVATLGLVDGASYEATRARVGRELEVGERVFARLLAQDAERLGVAARSLAADFAFREAVATGDAPTLNSALENLGGRVKAAATLFMDLGGNVVASTPLEGTAAGTQSLRDLVSEARHGADAHRILAIGGVAFEVVAVPVRAPVTVGWVVLFFPVDAALAGELKRLTGLDVSFGLVGAAGWRALASTLQPADAARLGAALPGGGRAAGSFSTQRGDGEHQARVVTLGAVRDGTVVAVLERALEPALRYARDLRLLLLALGAASLVLAAGSSLLIARGITRPLDRLLSAVRAIRGGDYVQLVRAERDDEIGAVAAGLDHMREGIRAREARILTLAYEDTLTGLPNRVRLNDELSSELGRAAAGHVPCAVVVLGLDRFRTVNDTLGHAAGDAVLAQLGERLRGLVAADCFVARLGGDEFALVLPGSSAADAEIAARTVQQLLECPFAHHGQGIDVRASIGIAAFPLHGADAQTLLRNADVAMYAAKRSRSGIACFDPQIDDAKRDHLSLLGELRSAVEGSELEVHYQPKLELASAHIGAAEALLRWRHPTRGRIPPGLFIPFAEQTGYIRELTRWVLAEVVRQVAEWRGRGLSLQVAVNLSTRDLMDENLGAWIGELLLGHDVPAACLRLEITESGFLDDPARAGRVLAELAARGHPLSIDDYGTGYSSLSYLRELPVDELKIDRSLVAGLADTPALATIVRSTVELGHGLGMHVVAEGIEEEADRRCLAELGCDAIQGYLISPPLPAEAFERWIKGALPPRSAATAATLAAPDAPARHGAPDERRRA